MFKPVPGIPDADGDTIVVAVRPSEIEQSTLDMLPASVRGSMRAALIHCASRFEGLGAITDDQLTPDQKARPDLVFFRVDSVGLDKILNLTRDDAWGTLVEL